MILDLDDVGKEKTEGFVVGSSNPSPSPLFPSTPKSPIIRIWFNTLIEYGPDGVKVVKSYSCPAKDSDAQRIIKPKKVKPKPKAVKKTQVKGVEEY